jgi:hypothetical protein
MPDGPRRAPWRPQGDTFPGRNGAKIRQATSSVLAAGSLRWSSPHSEPICPLQRVHVSVFHGEAPRNRSITEATI